jgi:CDP-diacylglycerol--serine O-phosphatidyltransferase
VEPKHETNPVEFLPNAVTLLAIGCALMAVRSAINGQALLVIVFIVAESVLDALDGRLARALKAESSMGAQLDSLGDAIGFGVAPGLIMYELTTQHIGNRWAMVVWFAAMVYTCCSSLRLARFNVSLDDEDLPDYEKAYFTGIPAPAASWLALVPLVASLAWGDRWWMSPVAVAIWLILVGVGAFSRLPTFSFKTIRPSRQMVAGALLVAAVLIAGLFTRPLPTLLLIALAYVLTIPFAVYRHHSDRQANPHTSSRT